MSSYRQFCGLAVALDAVGDRWSLLIVRELLVAPRRFSELRTALGGIASNLLTDRLRDLEQTGVVNRLDVPGRKAVEYSLTDRGQDLRAAVYALIRWGAEAMSEGPREDQVLRPDWVSLAVDAFVEPHDGLRAEVEDIGEAEGAQGDRLRLTLHRDRDPSATATVEGPAALVLGTAAGALTPSTAALLGATVHDPDRLLDQIRVRRPG